MHRSANVAAKRVAAASRGLLTRCSRAFSGSSSSSSTQCRSAIVHTAKVSEAPDFTPELQAFSPIKPATFYDNNNSYLEEYRIRGYEVTPDQQTTIVTMANLLQEIASNNCVGAWGRSDTGFATPASMKDMIFVMTRLQIRMHRYPKWGDVVQVQTYFAEEGRLAARRDWRIVDAETGDLLGVATSTWLAINIATRRICKMPDDLRNLFKTLTGTSSLHAIPPEETRKKLPDLDIAAQVEGPMQVARRSDMDMNGHINNATYVAWVMENVPEELYKSGHLYEIEVDFKAECLAGNTVEILCSEVDTLSNGTASSNGDSAVLQYLHTVKRCDTEAGCFELVRARTTWK